MNIPLTEYHDLIISSIGLDCQSGSWFANYQILDKFTKQTYKKDLVFDRTYNDASQTPEQMANKLAEFLKK